MIKRIVAALLAVTICIPFVLGAVPQVSEASPDAQKLNAPGLPNSTGTKSDGSAGFSPDRVPTRAKVAALLVLKALSTKLIGSETTLSSLLIEAGVFAEADVTAINIRIIADAPVSMAENMPAPNPEQIQTQTPDASVFEREIFSLINQERAENGLPPLLWDAGAANVARAHSLDMVQKNYFSHINLEGRRPSDRMRAAGIAFTYIAENIARGFRTSETAVAAWMASPSHRAAILSEQPERMGVGVHGDTWTVNFIK